MGRSRPLRPLRHALETGALNFLTFVARAIPLPAASDLGDVLGRMALPFLAKRRRIATENLERALGLSPRDAEAMTRAVFRQLGRSFVEFLALPAHGWDELNRRVVFDEGIARLEAHAKSGKGAVLVTAHYGNWELFGAAVGRRVGGVAYVFPPQSNPGSGARINETRSRLGVELIDMEQGMRRALKRVLQGGHIGMLMDQDARKIGVHVPFFGRPASTLTGPARLAIRARAPIYFGLLDRTGHATFEGKTLAWLEPIPGADEETELLRLTTAMNEALEKAVRERPDHWYWIHRRWKTPPPDPTT